MDKTFEKLNSNNQRILSNEEFKTEIESSIKSGFADKALVIFSAFIKSNAIKWLAGLVPSSCDVTIIGRWQPNDLLTKSSDLEVYKLCKEKEWKFGILRNLHSKIFLFGSDKVLIGSANLTVSGLSLAGTGNLEMGTQITPSELDIQRIEEIVSKVTWINDGIFNLLSSELELASENKVAADSIQWSKELKELLEPAVDKLWVDDLFYTTPTEFINPDNSDLEEVKHDLALLGLEHIEESDKALGLYQSKFYKWFKKKLITSPEEEFTSFGWLTAQLHNSLLDEPPPNRGGIKFFVGNFHSWVEVFAKEILIETHNHTSSYSLAVAGYTNYERKEPKGIKWEEESDSWRSSRDGDEVVKIIDFSCFKENSTGVPHRVCHFFGVKPKEEVELNLSLENKNQTFSAKIFTVKTGQMKLKWNYELTTLLREKLPEWEDIKPKQKPNLENGYIHFKKTSLKNRYIIDITPSSVLIFTGEPPL